VGVIAQGLIRTNDDKRAAYHDILVNTDACRDYIQRGSLDEVEEIMSRSSFDVIAKANQSLQALVEAGRINSDRAIEVSLKPNKLAQELRGRD
jgi:twitching motility protein PilT